MSEASKSIKNIQAIHQQKRTRVRELLVEGVKTKDIYDRIREEFGSGMAREIIYEIHHEYYGTKPRMLRKRSTQKKLATPPVKQTRSSKPKPPSTQGQLTTIPVPVSSVSRKTPAVDSLCEALVRAMRQEGVARIRLDSSGRGIVSHLCDREVDYGRNENY